LQIPGALDFSAVNVFGRLYFTPHDGKRGLANNVVWVYDGTNIYKAALGSGVATPALTASSSATAGNVGAGIHLVGIIFESMSGYISPPNQAVAVTAAGSKKILVSNIPQGPTGTVKRHIVVTKVIPSYSGNLSDYEFFRIPTGPGTINDNLTTAYNSDIDFTDSSLVESIEPQMDLLTEIPAGSFINFVKGGRLVIGGFANDGNGVYISDPGDPERFDAVDNYLTVYPGDSEDSLKNSVDYKGTIGLFKSLKSYYTVINDDLVPAEWEVLPLDLGVGTEAHGVSTILDRSGVHTDKFFVADRSGILMFNGIFQEPELTYKVRDIWRGIERNYFYKICIVYDPIKEHIYIAYPEVNQTENNKILFGDCSQGMSYDKIKWSVWTLPWYMPCIAVDKNFFEGPIVPDPGTIESTTRFLVSGDTIYEQQAYGNSPDYTDGGDLDPIAGIVGLALLPNKNDGQVNHFAGFSIRVQGGGNMFTSAYGINSFGEYTLPIMPINGTQTGVVRRRMNYITEKMKLVISCSDSVMTIQNIVVYFKRLYESRPA
jgi:hypothetical protein